MTKVSIDRLGWRFYFPVEFRCRMVSIESPIYTFQSLLMAVYISIIADSRIHFNHCWWPYTFQSLLMADYPFTMPNATFQFIDILKPTCWPVGRHVPHPHHNAVRLHFPHRFLKKCWPRVMATITADTHCSAISSEWLGFGPPKSFLAITLLLKYYAWSRHRRAVRRF